MSGCVKNITAFCQHLLRPIKSAILANIDVSVKPKYRMIYRLISSYMHCTYLTRPTNKTASSLKVLLGYFNDVSETFNKANFRFVTVLFARNLQQVCSVHIYQCCHSVIKKNPRIYLEKKQKIIKNPRHTKC